MDSSPDHATGATPEHEMLQVSRQSLQRVAGKQSPLPGEYAPDGISVREVTQLAQSLNDYYNRDLPPEYKAILRETVREWLSLDLRDAPDEACIIDISAVPMRTEGMVNSLEKVAQQIYNRVGEENKFIHNETGLQAEQAHAIMLQHSQFFHHASKQINHYAFALTHNSNVRANFHPSKYQKTAAKHTDLSVESLQQVASTWRDYLGLLEFNHPRFHEILSQALEMEMGLQFRPSVHDDEALQSRLKLQSTVNAPSDAVYDSGINRPSRLPITVNDLHEMHQSAYAALSSRIAHRIEQLGSQPSLSESDRESLTQQNRQFKGDIKILMADIERKVDALQTAPATHGLGR